MLAAARDGALRVLIVPSLSAISHDAVHRFSICAILAYYGVRVYVASNNDGVMMVHLDVLSNEMKSARSPLCTEENKGVVAPANSESAIFEA